MPRFLVWPNNHNGSVQYGLRGDTEECWAEFLGMNSRPPKWIKPQLTRLVAEAPVGLGWLHEIKYDGYRMHVRIARKSGASDL